MIRSPLIHMFLKYKVLSVSMLAVIVFVGLYAIWPRPGANRVAASPALSPLSAPSLALTAYFEADSANQGIGNLLLTVWAKASTEEEQGIPVKLTLRRLKNGFLQNHHVNVLHGESSATYVHGFTSIPLDEPIRITAEASLRGQDGQAKRFVEDVYLNSRPPLFSRPTYHVLMAVIVLLLGIFLWAFTGQSSLLKNRVAIIFSYLIIIIFLALPLLAPVILPLASPEALEVMKRTPVGLVVTDVKLEQELVPQWSLNIGGHVSSTTAAQDSPVVQVQGGLIVPLYVIILSVIGGAINMTRQVPKFQGEGEAQAARPKRRMNGNNGKALAASPRLAGLHSSDSAPQETRETRTAGHTSLADPHSRGREDTAAPHPPWRIELLNQYMFLISAPFLAIATYYMLIWLDLTKVPVIVLVAFSVGLISEPILCAITDTAVRLLRQQPPPISPAVGVGHATQAATAEPALVK